MLVAKALFSLPISLPTHPLALLVLLLSLSTSAFAGDKALAEELFNQAVELMDQGSTAAACEKFEASHQQDPSSGAALNLARCQEKLGKTATAWAQYIEAARMAGVQGRDDRVKEAQRRADEIKQKLSHLTIIVEEPVEALKIYRGELEIPEAAWGLSSPTDPGVLRITAKAPGYVERSFEITLGANADQQQLTVPPLQAEPPLVVPVVEKKEEPVVEEKEEPLVEPEAKPNRTLAYLIGGSGLAVVGAGVAFGIVSKSKYDSAEESCGGTTDCSSADMKQRSQATTYANLSNVAFGVGVAAVAAGTVLFFTAGTSQKEKSQFSRFEFTPLLSHKIAGALVSGSF